MYWVFHEEQLMRVLEEMADDHRNLSYDPEHVRDVVEEFLKSDVAAKLRGSDGKQIKTEGDKV